MLEISSKERVKLIHKGNEAFNKKQYPLAEKIFITVEYRDGLSRLAQYYFNQKSFFHASDLYHRAKNLKGEYSCFLALGLIKDIADFHALRSKKAMDDEINKKIAKTIQVFLSKNP